MPLIFKNKFFLFVILSLFITTNAHADRIIDNVLINGSSSVDYFVLDGKSVAITITVTITGNPPSPANQRWYSTMYKIGQGAWQTNNHAHFQSAGTHNVTFNIPANQLNNLAEGLHDIQFIALNTVGNNTNSIPSTTFTLSNALNVFPNSKSLNFDFSTLPSKKAEFDCDSLYLGSGRVTKIDIPTGTSPNGFSITRHEIYRDIESPTNNPGGPGLHEPGRKFRTLALGPFGEVNGTLSMFGWYWGSWGNIFQRKPSFVSNGTNIVTYLDLPSDFPKATSEGSGGTCWSGGEVNQMSGEIYFSGCENARFSTAGGRYMIYNPLTKTINLGSKIHPASDSDNEINNRIIGSDMSIDADGNFYSMVQSGDSRMWYLTRIVPGDISGSTKWKYNKVVKTKQLTGNQQSSSDLWGMAFLNGKLYVVFTRSLYEINPLSGEAIYKGDLNENADTKDLASCQVAPIIRGKVYLDVNGDGNISGTEESLNGIENVLIQIYDKNGVWLGEQYTSGTGEYSFIVPIKIGSTTTYYIRMKQPQINGANTIQTWASGGEYVYTGTLGGTNTATPFCYNIATPVHTNSTGKYPGQNIHSYGVECYGVKQDGIDGSSNTTSVANFMTKVDVETDRIVTYANFAVAPTDRSDAPIRYVSGSGASAITYEFGEVSHVMLSNKIKIGNSVSSDLNGSLASNYADMDTYDDSLQYYDDNMSSWKSVQGATFENYKNYKFKIKIDNVSVGSNLVLWTNWNNQSGITTDFSRVMLNTTASKNSLDGYEFNFMFGGNSSTNKTYNTYFRARISSSNISSSISPLQESVEANYLPWAMDGEVEDYWFLVNYYRNAQPLGSFHVVNEKVSKKEGEKISRDANHSDNALFTQVSGQDFKVKIYYTDNSTGEDIVSKPNYDLNVSLQIVDSSGNNISIPKKDINITTSDYYKEVSVQLSNNKKIAHNNVKFEIIINNPSVQINEKLYSLDNFAIRPASFIVNSTENFNRIVGGRNFDYNISAVAVDGNTITNNNYSSKIENFDATKHVVFDKPMGCTAVFDTNDLNANFDNFIGGISNSNITYMNIGVLNVTLVDNSWTSIDQNSKNKKGYDDCIVSNNSNTHDSSGKVGCDISETVQFVFVPSGFKNDLSLKNFNNGVFTYMSSDGANMLANILMTITATLGDDAQSEATNYHEDCWAYKTTADIQLNNDTPAGWNTGPNRDILLATQRINYVPGNNIQNLNSVFGFDGRVSFDIDQQQFQKGVAHDMNVKFNFIRRANLYENPFVINAVDFLVNSITDTEGTADIVLSDDGSTATFLYGRVFSNSLNDVISPAISNLRYEVYCGNGCDLDDYGLIAATKNLYGAWYINENHNGANFGFISGNYGQLSGNTNINIANNQPAPNNGRETITLTLNPNNPPYSDYIQMFADSWLLYDKDDATINFNKFYINFIGPNGDWAGVGQVDDTEKVGTTIQDLPSTNTKTKMDW